MRLWRAGLALHATLSGETTMKIMLTALLWYSGMALALPYHPNVDSEVLETLPTQLVESRDELKSLRQQAAAQADDPSPALRLVKRYIELGRAESDPRYYGYAEAALAPWLNNNPTPEALTLQATLYQNRHEFNTALTLLAQALARQPRLAQAWLTRAVILEVQGDYGGALKNCMALTKLAPPLTTATCVNSALSLSGQATAAYERLAWAIHALPTADEAEQQWALTTLAEIANRLGRVDEAERQFQAALALPTRSSYLLASYADFLLDQQRPAEVIPLLQDRTRADTLLLRLTLAEQRLNAPHLNQHIDALKDRFAASRLRGDQTHQSDEARFRLHLLHEADVALNLALENWKVQREPRDARIVLEAAQAAHKPNAARPVLAALAQRGVEDVKLATLSKPLQEHQP
jgi:Tfp pilus assembly protein PilF